MQTLTVFQIVTISLLSLLTLLTVILNVICIYVISKSKKLSKSPTSYLIRNLLGVHLLQGTVVFPIYIAKKFGSSSLARKRAICDGFRFTYMTTFYAAVFSILAIAVDRFIAVRFVMIYKGVVKKRRVTLCIIAFWVYVVVLCFIPFIDAVGENITRGYENRLLWNLSNVTFNTPVVQNNITARVPRQDTCDYAPSQLWTTLMLIINCLLPYVIIIFVYQFIVSRVRHIQSRTQGRNTKGEISTRVPNETARGHQRLNRMSMLLSCVYLLCWLPSIIYYIIERTCPNACFSTHYKNSSLEKYVSFYIKYLAYLDAVASPLVYCFYNKSFRTMIPCLNFGNADGNSLLRQSMRSTAVTETEL